MEPIRCHRHPVSMPSVLPPMCVFVASVRKAKGAPLTSERLRGSFMKEERFPLVVSMSMVGGSCRSQALGCRQASGLER